jgi:beta-glucanase (GH16 family)
MKMIQHAILISFFIVPSFYLKCQTPATDPHWQLVWEDNFNFLDTSIWQVHDLDGGKNAKGINIAQNVNTVNGNLELTLKKENFSCPAWAVHPLYFCVNQYLTGQPYQYTSGKIHNKQAYNTQYGYIEARIKVPYVHGIFPAFWTFLGDGEINSGHTEEIDIFEIIASDVAGVGFDNPSILHTNIHNFYFDPNCPDSQCDVADPLVIKLDYFIYSDWHIYAVEWNPNRITWYVDGKIIRILYNHDVVDPQTVTLNHGVLNSDPPNGANLPTKMMVDYVHVYELKNDCNTSLDICSYDYSNHDNKVKKKIIIGNLPTCSSTLDPGDKVHLRASEEIRINYNFTIPIGAECFMNVDPCN